MSGEIPFFNNTFLDPSALVIVKRIPAGIFSASIIGVKPSSPSIPCKLFSHSVTVPLNPSFTAISYAEYPLTNYDERVPTSALVPYNSSRPVLSSLKFHHLGFLFINHYLFLN